MFLEENVYIQEKYQITQIIKNEIVQKIIFRKKSRSTIKNLKKRTKIKRVKKQKKNKKNKRKRSRKQEQKKQDDLNKNFLSTTTKTFSKNTLNKTILKTNKIIKLRIKTS